MGRRSAPIGIGHWGLVIGHSYSPDHGKPLVPRTFGPPLFLEGLGVPGAHQLKDVTAFLLLVLVLIFRPQGIVGERLPEKKA